MSNALEVRDLARAFGGITAVDGVSFAVEQAEIVGLIGPNGSGKSTVFNLITGVHKPDRGRVLYFGRDITKQPSHKIARAGLSRTFQLPALFVNMTVRQNLLAAAVEGDWRGAPASAANVMELLDLSAVSEQLAGSLSGGQQRLLEMGRVLMQGPRLVLLDEVAAGVHPQLREIILHAIRELRAQDTTFLVIEHDLELTKDVCDRVIVMDAGKIVAEGSFEQITHDPQVMEAYLGVPAE